jgi:hypothetical protein
VIRDIYIDTYNRNKPKVEKSKQASRKGKRKRDHIASWQELASSSFFFLDPPAFYHPIYAHT